MTRNLLAAATLVAMTPALAMADVTGSPFTYSVGAMVFEGYAAHDPDQDSRGTVLIVHDWDGMTDYEQERARMLAAEGYTAFAVDLYGAEADPQGMEDYRALSGALYADRATFRDRLAGSIAAAAGLPGATDNVVIIGYCFGGAAVLEAARAGADLAGFVSFHGGLPTPEGQDWSAANGAPIRFFHGSADPVSDVGDLAQVMAELLEAGIPHGAEIYGGARHSFTVTGSRDYDAAADADSWEGLMDFLSDTL